MVYRNLSDLTLTDNTLTDSCLQQKFECSVLSVVNGKELLNKPGVTLTGCCLQQKFECSYFLCRKYIELVNKPFFMMVTALVLCA